MVQSPPSTVVQAPLLQSRWHWSEIRRSRSWYKHFV